jgi:hypothetical protein
MAVAQGAIGDHFRRERGSDQLDGLEQDLEVRQGTHVQPILKSTERLFRR